MRFEVGTGLTVYLLKFTKISHKDSLALMVQVLASFYQMSRRASAALLVWFYTFVNQDVSQRFSCTPWQLLAFVYQMSPRASAVLLVQLFAFVDQDVSQRFSYIPG